MKMYTKIFKSEGFEIKTNLCFILLSLLTTFLTFFIVYNANWLFGDDLIFLRTTAIGKLLPLSEGINMSGRFFPLGHYDFNILLLPGLKSATAHYVFSAISFIVFVTCISFFYSQLIYKISKDRRYTSWLVMFCVIFLMARFYPMFFYVIFPERLVIVLLSVFIILCFRFNETDHWKYGIPALFLAACLVYCKEPVSVALLVFSGTILIINNKGLTKYKRIFYSLLVVNSILFLFLYNYFVIIHSEILYTGGNRPMSVIELLIKVFRDNKVLIPAFGLAFIRLFLIFYKKEKKYLIYDGFLFSGIAYTFAVLMLKLNFSYYYFPAVVLCFPALVFWSVHYLNVKRVALILFVFALFSSVKLADYIKTNQAERISTYPKIVRLAELSKEGYQIIWYQPKLSSSDLFNIQLRDYKKESLEGYLNYVFNDASCFKMNIMTDIKTEKLRMIVLYPEENIANVRENLEFKKSIEQNNGHQLTDIKGIQVYQLN